MTILLVVDDDPAIRALVGGILRDEGFEVRTANDGLHARFLLTSEGPVDGIVLDLNMPLVDGRTFFRELRAHGDDTPVLVLSANSAQAAAGEMGAEDSLEKPFDPEELVKRVRNLVHSASRS